MFIFLKHGMQKQEYKQCKNSGKYQNLNKLDTLNNKKGNITKVRV